MHMRVNLRDTVRTTREITPEGYLRGKAAITEVGVQPYYGYELSGLIKDIKPNKVYNVFRSPDVVFHPDTISSARMKPITYDHPEQDVVPGNYRDMAVGTMGDKVGKLTDRRLGANIMITDPDIIEKVMNQGAEVSLGYEVDIVEEDGEFNGKSYQYKFDGPMRVNHLAVVDEGRCGDGVRILDSKCKEQTNMLKKKAKIEDRAVTALIKDVDMDSLMEKMAMNLMPKLEEMMAGDDFMEMMASKMASMMMSEGAEDEDMIDEDMGEEDMMDEDMDDGMYEDEDMHDGDMKEDRMHDEDEKEKLMEARREERGLKGALEGDEEKLDRMEGRKMRHRNDKKPAGIKLKKMADAKVAAKINLLDKARSLKAEVTPTMSNKQIVFKALAKITDSKELEDLKTKSFDYLEARLDMALSKRENGGCLNVSDSHNFDVGDAPSYNALKLRKMKKGA